MTADRLIVVRGGGDLATGVVWRLHATGHRVLVTELSEPLTVRRTVSLSEAVRAGSTTVEGMTGRCVTSPAEIAQAHLDDVVPVLVSPWLPELPGQIDAVIDARLTKRNIDTSRSDAHFVVGLGPGFTAGVDCDAVVETMRGHRLGRVLWTGTAIANTGVPGLVGGLTNQRVLRASVAGQVQWFVEIGDRVDANQALGIIEDSVIAAPFDGIVRGLIHPGTSVALGLKIGDVDPRINEFSTPNAADTISDKALAIGGGVLEAVLAWTSGRFVREPTPV